MPGQFLLKRVSQTALGDPYPLLHQKRGHYKLYSRLPPGGRRRCRKRSAPLPVPGPSPRPSASAVLPRRPSSPPPRPPLNRNGGERAPRQEPGGGAPRSSRGRSGASQQASQTPHPRGVPAPRGRWGRAKRGAPELAHRLCWQRGAGGLGCGWPTRTPRPALAPTPASPAHACARRPALDPTGSSPGPH